MLRTLGPATPPRLIVRAGGRQSACFGILASSCTSRQVAHKPVRLSNVARSVKLIFARRVIDYSIAVGEKGQHKS